MMEPSPRTGTQEAKTRPTRTRQKVLFLIVLAALSIRLALLYYFQSYMIESDWAFGYETGRIAEAIATGKGFSSPFPEPTGPTAWLMPAYPYFLALIFKIFGVYTTQAALVALAANCLLSALSCAAIFYVAAPLFGEAAGYGAAVVLALYPPSVWHAINTIWDTTAFAFLSIVLIAWVIQLPGRLTLHRGLLLGLFMGFMANVNAVILIYYPFVALWLLFHRSQTWKDRFQFVTTITLATCLMLTPWLVRNHRVFDRVMLRSNFGLELRLGNNEPVWDALVSGRHYNVLDDHPTNSESELLRYQAMGEIPYMDEARKEAIAFIAANPAKFFRLSLDRMALFWFGEKAGASEWTGNLRTSISLSGIKKMLHLLPLPFMMVGIALAMGQRRPAAPLLAFLFLVPLVYYFTHVAERYRFIVEPVILVFGVYALSPMTRLWKGKGAAGTTGDVTSLIVSIDDNR